jgi:adenine-specific DNA-methyltransferase
VGPEGLGTPAAVLPASSFTALIEELAAEVAARVQTGPGAAAYEVWKAHAYNGSELADVEVFAAEVAFASAARMMLELDLGADHGQSEAFPHLYGELFGWFRPAPETAAAAAEALSFVDRDGDDTLSWLYQYAIPLEVRKQFGQFYTRPPIVNLQLDNAGFVGVAILNAGRLIDPACGAGAYLTEATRRVLRAAEEAGLDAEQTYEAVRSIIHGLDFNPLGVLLSEAALARLLLPTLRALPDGAELGPLQLFVTDSLRLSEHTSADSRAAQAGRLKACSGEYTGGFAWVVGNPPYAKYPSRLFVAEQSRRFSLTTYGHPNLYGLFIQVGVELLGEGGRLCFINPKSFVSGLYFRNLRTFLNEQVHIERFDDFSSRSGIFDGVLQELVILTARRGGEPAEHITLRVFEGMPSGPPMTEVRVSPSSVQLDQRFDYAYFVSADPLAHRVLDAMSSDSVPLRELCYTAVTGTIVWNRLKEHVRDETADEALPLVWGNGLRLFRFMGLGNRDGRASHMALVHKTQNIVSHGPAILVKRMTAKEERRRIVACRVPEELARSERGYFAENHVNIVRAANGSTPEVPLDAVLGLLNSALFDYMFRSLNGNTQVSATELEMLPVRVGSELEEIARLARLLTDSGGTDEQAFIDLNTQVFKLYGIAADDAAALVRH